MPDIDSGWIWTSYYLFSTNTKLLFFKMAEMEWDLSWKWITYYLKWQSWLKILLIVLIQLLFPLLLLLRLLKACNQILFYLVILFVHIRIRWSKLFIFHFYLYLMFTMFPTRCIAILYLEWSWRCTVHQRGPVSKVLLRCIGRVLTVRGRL